VIERTRYSIDIIIIIIIIIKNEKIRVTLCKNAAGALYIVNNTRETPWNPSRISYLSIYLIRVQNHISN